MLSFVKDNYFLMEIQKNLNDLYSLYDEALAFYKDYNGIGREKILDFMRLVNEIIASGDDYDISLFRERLADLKANFEVELDSENEIEEELTLEEILRRSETRYRMMLHNLRVNLPEYKKLLVEYREKCIRAESDYESYEIKLNNMLKKVAECTNFIEDIDIVQLLDQPNKIALLQIYYGLFQDSEGKLYSLLNDLSILWPNDEIL